MPISTSKSGDIYCGALNPDGKPLGLSKSLLERGGGDHCEILFRNGIRYKGFLNESLVFSSHGKLTYSSGAFISGEFDSHAVTGLGIFSPGPGSRYEGEFTRGLPSGRGLFRWDNDEGTPAATFFGDFVMGRPSGLGEYVDETRGLKLTGEWNHGVPHGRAIISFRGAPILTLLFVKGKIIASEPRPDFADPEVETMLGTQRDFDEMKASTRRTVMDAKRAAVEAREVGERVDRLRDLLPQSTVNAIRRDSSGSFLGRSPERWSMDATDLSAALDKAADVANASAAGGFRSPAETRRSDRTRANDSAVNRRDRDRERDAKKKAERRERRRARGRDRDRDRDHHRSSSSSSPSRPSSTSTHDNRGSRRRTGRASVQLSDSDSEPSLVAPRVTDPATPAQPGPSAGGDTPFTSPASIFADRFAERAKGAAAIARERVTSAASAAQAGTATLRARAKASARARHDVIPEGEPVPLDRWFKAIMAVLEAPDSLKTQGVFRIPGDRTVILQWRAAAARSGANLDAVLRAEQPGSQHVHNCASALKLFLSEGPPLLGFQLYDAFVAAGGATSAQTNAMTLESLRPLLAQVPATGGQPALCTRLLRYFKRMADHGDVNMMHIHNVCRVVGPSLLREEEQTMSSMGHIPVIGKIAEVLMTSIDQLPTIFGITEGEIAAVGEPPAAALDGDDAAVASPAAGGGAAPVVVTVQPSVSGGAADTSRAATSSAAASPAPATESGQRPQRRWNAEASKLMQNFRTEGSMGTQRRGVAYKPRNDGLDSKAR